MLATAGFRDDLASLVLGTGRMYAAFVADETNVDSVTERVRVGFEKATTGGFFDKAMTSAPVVIGPELLPEGVPAKTCGLQRTKTWRSSSRRVLGGIRHLSNTSSVSRKQPPPRLVSK